MIENNAHHRSGAGIIPRDLLIRFPLGGYRCFLVALIFFLSLLIITPLLAEDLDDWSAAKVRLEQLGNGETSCEDSWNLLWPWAKKGNYEARNILLFSMASLPDMDVLLPPGSTDDRLSRQRDVIIMLTHSLEYRGGNMPEEYKKDLQIYREQLFSLYQQIGFGNDPKSEEFMRCVMHAGKDCALIAVREKLVPSFEEYAEQIDSFLEKGMKARCMKS